MDSLIAPRRRYVYERRIWLKTQTDRFGLAKVLSEMAGKIAGWGTAICALHRKHRRAVVIGDFVIVMLMTPAVIAVS
jgi:hypothetical protein